jgi:parvulin-like peptidyl-prolyl isomerase
MQEWLRNADRKEGDITALKRTTKSKDANGKEIETLNGYYIVMFKSVNDNKYALANVRHILVAFEGGTTDKNTGKKTYSDAEKNKAKDEAQKLLDEWLKGAKTEDSFAELAKKYTNDSNGEQGGLYEDVYPGQMVTTFNDFCFADGRKAGDHDIIETEYGWHVMFYSGDSKTNYRDYMVTKDKLTVDMEAWQKSLVDAISLTEKNTKFVNKDYIIQPANNLGM